MTKTYRFDINVEAWISSIDIEADNLEDAKDILSEMSLKELTSPADVREYDITDDEYTVIGDDEDDEDDIEYDDYYDEEDE